MMSEKAAPVSPKNKLIARQLALVFGGTPRVGEYRNTTETLTVDILSCGDRPVDGVTSYSTIKLSDHPIPWGEREFSARLELAGLCVNTVTTFPNLLASAAFHIMQSDALYHPGTVIPDLVRRSQVSSTLPHLYLTAPFPWGDSLNRLNCGPKKVTWLLAMPISEPEYAFLREHGDLALERLLQKQDADFSNPDRPTVVKVGASP
jgi:antitoxin YqcF